MQGKTEGDALRASRLLDALRDDAVAMPEELGPAFALVDVDERQIAARNVNLHPVHRRD